VFYILKSFSCITYNIYYKLDVSTSVTRNRKNVAFQCVFICLILNNIKMLSLVFYMLKNFCCKKIIYVQCIVEKSIIHVYKL